MSKKKAIVSLSTTNDEYMEATHASKEDVWLQSLCSGIGFVQKSIRLDCDSQSEIFLENNLAYHAKTKNIDVQYHFVRDMVEDKKVLLEKVDTLKNVVDSLTKFVTTKRSLGVENLWALMPRTYDFMSTRLFAMQRKQQVGECWVYVIFFACVCGGEVRLSMLRLTIPINTFT